MAAATKAIDIRLPLMRDWTLAVMRFIGRFLFLGQARATGNAPPRGGAFAQAVQQRGKTGF
ncbi:hypothetical protein Rmet_6458 [Cupriavidus metallidurans CH34]|uniref:Uncharacterized protein n=1 Tax=Cupriavidus metallidurans (strain ATCC 43123 / DSM 2839 / NBRC 102507 / CH34) TaxID=266264 RepID=D3DXQ3_CUPMC|nr:hypothetical protein Rmet_6458 [Cupriavidus metallidurans CH34]